MEFLNREKTLIILCMFILVLRGVILMKNLLCYGIEDDVIDEYFKYSFYPHVLLRFW